MSRSVPVILMVAGAIGSLALGGCASKKPDPQIEINRKAEQERLTTEKARRAAKDELLRAEDARRVANQMLQEAAEAEEKTRQEKEKARRAKKLQYIK
ncbi:MAG: hypothetical protein H7833_03310 [Magnetococcus sp. DMHC-1]|nr:hypothetical protein [Magnetococcales bacterium]